MKNAAYAEVWVSLGELSDAEFLERLNETVEYIALDTASPIDPTADSPPVRQIKQGGAAAQSV